MTTTSETPQYLAVRDSDHEIIGAGSLGTVLLAIAKVRRKGTCYILRRDTGEVVGTYGPETGCVEGGCES
jgi:hypothetical protein